MQFAMPIANVGKSGADIEEVVDVLVIGAGAAGMTAALASRAKGLGVLIVEASTQVGGTTSTSAGTLWLPGIPTEASRKTAASSVDKAQAEARLQAQTYLRASIGTAADIRKIDALLDSGPELLRFLHEHSEVRLDPVAVHPDYLQHLPGASLGGRAFAPREFDGRRLGKNFARVRAPMPEFMVFGGMMVSKTDIPLLLSAHRNPKAFGHAMKLGARYAFDRLGGHRGSRLVMGNALVAQLFYSALKAGASFEFETRVERLDHSADSIVCSLKSAGGELRSLRVRRGVILATGGFSGDSGMRERWLPKPARARSVAHRGENGGGIALGIAAGAAVEADHGTNAFWMPVSTMRRRDGSQAVFPHIALDRAKPGSLAVDSSGHRFTNEADAYHHFCEAMLERSAVEPHQRFFLIADFAFVQRYGIGMIRPGQRPSQRFVDGGYLMRARSPAEMAKQLRIDEDSLSRTLDRYNRNAANGIDPDFRRGESALNRHNGDVLHGPNPCLRPINCSDLCAVELSVADLATSAGLATDEHARVLDASGRPIQGVFACGNDMASMMRGSYPGPGTTLGPGMTFAWRAAQALGGTEA